MLLKKYREKVLWFAWYPVWTTDGIVWLESVIRITRFQPITLTPVFIHVRFKETTK